MEQAAYDRLRPILGNLQLDLAPDAHAFAAVGENVLHQEIGRRLDLTNFVDYLLLNVYTSMGDWPQNNWRAGRDSITGRWKGSTGSWEFTAWMPCARAWNQEKSATFSASGWNSTTNVADSFGRSFAGRDGAERMAKSPGFAPPIDAVLITHEHVDHVVPDTLTPALAAWALLLIETTLRKAGAGLYEVAPKFGGDLYVYGIIALSQGFMLSGMILSAMMVFVVEREFFKAALWTATAALLSFFGVIHAYVLTPAGMQNRFGAGAAKSYALAYLIAALLLVALHYYNRGRESEKTGIVA